MEAGKGEKDGKKTFRLKNADLEARGRSERYYGKDDALFWTAAAKKKKKKKIKQ